MKPLMCFPHPVASSLCYHDEGSSAEHSKLELERGRWCYLSGGAEGGLHCSELLSPGPVHHAGQPLLHEVLHWGNTEDVFDFTTVGKLFQRKRFIQEFGVRWFLRYLLRWQLESSSTRSVNLQHLCLEERLTLKCFHSSWHIEAVQCFCIWESEEVLVSIWNCSHARKDDGSPHNEQADVQQNICRPHWTLSGGKITFLFFFPYCLHKWHERACCLLPDWRGHMAEVLSGRRG